MVLAAHMSSRGRSHAYRLLCSTRVTTDLPPLAWKICCDRTRHQDRMVTHRPSRTRLVSPGATISANTLVRARRPSASPRLTTIGSQGSVNSSRGPWVGSPRCSNDIDDLPSCHEHQQRPPGVGLLPVVADLLAVVADARLFRSHVALPIDDDLDGAGLVECKRVRLTREQYLLAVPRLASEHRQFRN